ncbi:hypothetical protein [Luteibacter yeojuensis]|uniref:Uncharacterized protein n=1 Tax=Luteibacter yeojuensis TaxID=345309 RepID=A0A0F3KGP2_9GAMM|nr:hypothetical protein [Luteibacter yeojuensis]KJV30425.1 hypothetical protein VI08_15055 [Luteibacter yeojuensis]
MAHHTTFRFESISTRQDETSDAYTKERDIAPEYTPLILNAYADGLIPTAALGRGLTIHASAMKYPGRNTWPNDEFHALLNGAPLDGVRAVYEGGGGVVLHIPSEVCHALPDGVHDVAYRITFKPMGHQTRSGSVQIRIDRQPAGGRLLPRIEFPESLYMAPITSDTFAAFPGERIVGIVPDYAWVSGDDTLHVYVRPTGGDGVLIASVPASSGDDPTKISFGMLDLSQSSADDRLDIYYMVEDRAGNLSEPSSPSKHTVQLDPN